MTKEAEEVMEHLATPPGGHPASTIHGAYAIAYALMQVAKAIEGLLK